MKPIIFLILFIFLVKTAKIEFENQTLKTSSLDSLSVFLSSLRKSRKNMALSDNLQRDLDDFREISTKLFEKSLSFREKNPSDEGSLQILEHFFTEIGMKLSDFTDSSQLMQRVSQENAETYESALRNLKESLTSLSSKLKKSLFSNSIKKQEVKAETQQLFETTKNLESENKLLQFDFDSRKSKFADFLKGLESLLEGTRLSWEKFKALKQKSQDLSEETKKIKLEVEKIIVEAEKANKKTREVNQKTKNLAGKNHRLRKQVEFYQEMVRNVNSEKAKKLENLKGITKKIEDLDYQREKSGLELKTQKSEREGVLEEMKGKVRDKMQKIDEEVESQRKKEREKKEKIGRLEELAQKIRMEMEKAGVKGDLD